MTGRIVDLRPRAMLERQGRISRARLAKFGAMPDDLGTWWSQIQQAAAAEALEPGTLADWRGPERPSLWRPVGASIAGQSAPHVVPQADRPPYKPLETPAAKRAAELAKAFHADAADHADAKKPAQSPDPPDPKA